MLGSLSGESVEHVVQRAKSSENEDVTTTEDTVEYTADWSGDVAENSGEYRDRKKLSRRHCDDWQRRPEIVREPDYLKFLAEAEKEAG